MGAPPTLLPQVRKLVYAFLGIHGLLSLQLLLCCFLASRAAKIRPLRLFLGSAVALTLLFASPPLYRDLLPSWSVQIAGMFCAAALKAIGFCIDFERRHQLPSAFAYIVDMIKDIAGVNVPTRGHRLAAVAAAQDSIAQQSPTAAKAALGHAFGSPLIVRAYSGLAPVAPGHAPENTTSSNNSSTPQTATSSATQYEQARRYLRSPNWQAAAHHAGMIISQMILFDFFLTTLKVLRLPADSDAGLVDPITAISEHERLLRIFTRVFGKGVALLLLPALPQYGFWAHRLHCCLFGAALYLHFSYSYNSFMCLLAVVAPALHAILPPLFDKPWMASSPRDLWGKRWHKMFRADFTRLAQTPARNLMAAVAKAAGLAPLSTANSAVTTAAGSRVVLARRPAALRFAESFVPILAVFLLSGLVHEYMVFGGFGAQFADGRQLAFFLLHAGAVVLEGVVDSLAPHWRDAVPLRIRHAATLLLLVLTSSLFMGPWLDAGFQRNFMHPLRLLRLVGDALAA